MKAEHFAKLVDIKLKPEQERIANSFDENESGEISICKNRQVGASFLMRFCAAQYVCTHIGKFAAFGSYQAVLSDHDQKFIEHCLIPQGFIEESRRGLIKLRNGSKIKFFRHTRTEDLRGYSIDALFVDDVDLSHKRNVFQSLYPQLKHNEQILTSGVPLTTNSKREYL
jgi:hypothetical protein